MAINLLPVELAPKGSAIKVGGYLRSLALILASLFLVFSLGVAAFFTINLLQLRSLGVSTKTLSERITSLEATEQDFFLVKDRLGYAKEILTGSSAQKNFQKMSTVLASLPLDVTLTQVDVGKDKFSISIKTLSSTSLTTFMSGIVANPDFTKITLTSFTYSPTAGYGVSFEFF